MIEFLKIIAEKSQVLLIIIFVACLVWMFAKFYFTRFRKVEKEYNKVEKIVIPLLRKIILFLVSSDKKLKSEIMFTSFSPVTLNKKGVELLEKCGGKKYIDDNLEYLISKLKSEVLKTKLDVHEHAKFILLIESDSDEFVPIKNYIYDNPKYIGLDINLPMIVSVLALYLRDKYLESVEE